MTKTIDDLPDDILEQIVQNIPLDVQKGARRQLMLVSKKWKELADSSLGLEIFIGSSPWSGWESIAGSNHVELSKIEEIGVATCHVGEIYREEDIRPKPTGFVNWIWGKVKDIFGSTPIPSFKHPHLLRLIRFSGIIRDDYFKALLLRNTMFNLRQLQFNHSALSLLEPTSLENLGLESLHYLEVMADFSYIFWGIDDSKILKNILALLGNSFPRLTACNLYIPFEHERELTITKTFFNFTLKNGRRLKFVEIFYFYMMNEEDDIDMDEDSTQIVDEELNRIVDVASQILNLRVFIGHVNVDGMRCFPYWRRLLANQRSLEFIVVLSEHQIFSESLIQRISPTIKVILGTVDTRESGGQSTPLNCQILQECPHLVHLSLQGRYEDYVLLSNIPGMVNPQLLPHSIRHMDLSKFSILTTDLEKILLDTPNLMHFVGKFLGRTGLMGVTADLLRQVIEMRQLRWFHLAACFNGPFPDGFNNGHATRPSLLSFQEDCFCCKISISGFYVMASPLDELLASMSVHSQHTMN